MTGIAHERGLLLLRESRYAEAAAEFRRALEENPEHQVALDRLGWCLANLGEFAEAKAKVGQAISIVSEKAHRSGKRYDAFRFYTTLGAIHCLAGEPDAALLVLQQGDPDNWYNMYWEATALKLAGRTREALELAREAQRRAPKPFVPPLSQEVARLIADCEQQLTANSQP